MSENTITLTDSDVTAVNLAKTLRTMVNSRPRWDAYVKAHQVTRETVAVHAAALASFTFPDEEKVQKREGKRTRYGNAVQAAAFNLRKSLAPVEKDETATDYLARIIKSVDAGIDHDLDAAAILKAVTAHVDSLLA